MNTINECYQKEGWGRMYRKTTSSWLKHWDFMLLDFILLQVAFALAYMFRNGLEFPYHSMIYRSVAVLLGMLDLCLVFFMGGYGGILRRGYWIEFKDTVRHVALNTAGIIIYLFAIKSSEEVSRLAMGYFPFIAVVLLYLGRILLKHWLKRHKGPASGKRAMVLVTSKDNYKDAIDNFLNNPYSEFHIVGAAVVDWKEGQDAALEQYRGVEVTGNQVHILDFIRSNWVDEVLFSIPMEVPFPDDLYSKCTVMGITVHLKLARLGEDLANQVVEKIEGYTVLSSSVNMATAKQVFFKRAMDIAGGIVGLILTGLIFIVVAPIIYIKSPGPIFFKQWRVGKNGRKFKICKFRSMYMDAEERKKELMAQNNIKDGMMFKMDDDPRIIKGIGNFIRDYSLDEFPQFWNVLKGDMSLVGTRPPTVDEWEKYDLHHRTRLAIKPGLTGLWQVSGRSKITDFEEVVRLDTEYIKKWSIGQDMKILLKTVGVVLGKEGSM